MNELVNKKMHKYVNSNEIIERLKDITGWTKTKIAEEVFDISINNLGNRVKRDGLDLYKLLNWSVHNNVDINRLLMGSKIRAEKSSDSSGSKSGAQAIAEYVRKWASKNEKDNFQPIINALCLFLDMATKEHDEFRDRLNAIEQDMKEEKSPDGKEHRKLWKKYMRLVK